MFRKRLKIEGMFLRSKVARRVFTLFILSAFVPAVLLAVLSYTQLRGLNQDYVRQQLRGEAGNYARGVYERLLGAHLTLSVHVAGLRQGARLVDAGAQATQRIFRGIESGKAFMSQMSVPVADEVVRAHLARGESAIQLMRKGSEMVVLMVQALDPAQPEKDVVVGELDPTYLWGEDDDFSDQMQTCVLATGGQVLFCSDLQRVGLNGTDVVRAVAQNGPIQDWQSYSRALFLRARFAASDWNVVALHAPGAEGALRSQLAYTSLGVIVLTLLLVAFLGVTQIRRTLVPLERLLEGTQRIAREEFRQPVRIERDDEFGQLGAALNNMAARLGRQIGTLRALSEIDQEILSRVDMSGIIARVQERLQGLWPNAVTGVIVFDQMAADFGIVHLHSGEAGVTAKIPTKLEPWLMERLARDYDGLWFDANNSDLPDFLDMMSHSGAKRILVLPIYWNDRVNGLLAIGLKEPREFSADQVRQARDLGNRIGVALATHARDEELKFRAYHDRLTGLPNRPLLMERLNQEIAHARRNSRKIAILFLDLDRFKNVNDSMGHDAGDRLLCQVADRLLSCTREGDSVARMGGDEFVVLLPGLTDPQQAARLASEMMDLLKEPFQLEGGENHMGASVGVSIFPDDGNLAPDLLKKADMAMYRAKATGRGRIVFFEENMNIEQQERTLLEQDLRHAIAHNQLSLHYQPRFRLADRTLCGAEALLRWQHPDHGWVPLAKFMPLAEDLGLTDEIGQWMLREVCEQLAQWESAGCQLDVVTVNVTPGQLKSGRLVKQVEHVLHDTGVLASRLELELVEGALGEKIEGLDRQLMDLKRMGVTIALEDFGTGYSSLDILQRLPIDVLKIGAGFIQKLGRDTGATAIVYSILTLAHGLGKTVLAQGVEQTTQEELLRSWGCEQAQGDYFSQPMTASELEEMMTPSRPAELV